MGVDELDLLVLGHLHRHGASAREEGLGGSERPLALQPGDESLRALEERSDRVRERAAWERIQFRDGRDHIRPRVHQLPRYVVSE